MRLGIHDVCVDLALDAVGLLAHRRGVLGVILHAGLDLAQLLEYLQPVLGFAHGATLSIKVILPVTPAVKMETLDTLLDPS